MKKVNLTRSLIFLEDEKNYWIGEVKVLQISLYRSTIQNLITLFISYQKLIKMMVEMEFFE